MHHDLYFRSVNFRLSLLESLIYYQTLKYFINTVNFRANLDLRVKSQMAKGDSKIEIKVHVSLN